MFTQLRASDEFAEKNMLQKGFTLVELLVVVVILGILAAVVVFAVGGSTESAQDSACEAEARTVEAALEAYNAYYKTYPAAGGPSTPGDLGATYLRSAPEWTSWTATGGISQAGDCS